MRDFLRIEFTGIQNFNLSYMYVRRKNRFFLLTFYYYCGMFYIELGFSNKRGFT